MVSLNIDPGNIMGNMDRYPSFLDLPPPPATPADRAGGKEKLRFLCAAKFIFVMIYAHMSPTFGESWLGSMLRFWILRFWILRFSANERATDEVAGAGPHPLPSYPPGGSPPGGLPPTPLP